MIPISIRILASLPKELAPIFEDIKKNGIEAAMKYYQDEERSSFATFWDVRCAPVRLMLAVSRKSLMLDPKKSDVGMNDDGKGVKRIQEN